jgi:hypothetical protein
MGGFHSCSVIWASRYGLKESLVLTRMCEKTFMSGEDAMFNDEVLFSKKMFETDFPYFTAKQLRSVLDELIENGCVVGREPKSVDRTVVYFVTNKTYAEYKEFLLKE